MAQHLNERNLTFTSTFPFYLIILKYLQDLLILSQFSSPVSIIILYFSLSFLLPSCNFSCPYLTYTGVLGRQTNKTYLWDRAQPLTQAHISLEVDSQSFTYTELLSPTRI